MPQQRTSDTNPVSQGKVCLVCGKPATHAACDLMEMPGGTTVQNGPWRFGCDEHKQTKSIRRLNGTVERG